MLAQSPEVQAPWSLNRVAVDRWLDRSKPGETIVYGRGRSPSALKSDGVKAMQEAFDEGRVTFKSQRHGDCDHSFIAERKAEASRPAPSARLTKRFADEDGDEIALLMASLRRRANRGLRMGTNRELAEEIGATGPDRIAYLLRKLISAGRIEVESFGIGSRVCTIVATGKRTAL